MESSGCRAQQRDREINLPRGMRGTRRFGIRNQEWVVSHFAGLSPFAPRKNSPFAERKTTNGYLSQEWDWMRIDIDMSRLTDNIDPLRGGPVDEFGVEGRGRFRTSSFEVLPRGQNRRCGGRIPRRG